MYHVGSKDEHSGRTGLAHLLEHLLFEGSENCAKGEFDLLLEAAGGSNNGSTWWDRTEYHEVVPTHAVELALWLERERMAHFLPVLDRAMLELQRGVVINERLQSYENRPYGLAEERLQQLLFGTDHPYGWPTIGHMADLEAIALEDARAFFARFYHPANATLVLAGDVTAERGWELAENYFGDLPGGPVPQRSDPPEPGGGSAAERRATLKDRVSFPRVYRAYRVPRYGTGDWVALDALGYLLTDGESSRLQRELVRERELVQDVHGYLYPTELEGVFGIVATARSGIGADRIEDAIDGALARVAEEGVRDEELAGAIRRLRRDQLSAFAHVEDRADELAYAATVLGSAEALNDVLSSYRSLSPDDVQRAARNYLDGGRGAALIVDGEGGGDE